LLEIGPGTGQATLPLARKGYEITAIELGSNLAEVLHYKLRKYLDTKVIIGAFEEVNLPPESLDLIYSATAFHWVKPEAKYKKTYQLLKPNGYLAIIHTNHISDEKGDSFFDASQPIYDKFFPENKGNKFRLPHQEGIKPEDIDKKFFKVTFFNLFPLTISYTANEYSQLLNTFSPNLALPSDKRKEFLNEIKGIINEEFNGKIDKAYAMSLTISRKKIL
ncbi:hypothetical protein BVY00_02520, partial [bacterium G20]